MRSARGWRLWVRRGLRALLGFVLLLLLAAGGYVGYVTIRHNQTVTLPEPTGTFGVGRTIDVWTDSHRTDPLASRGRPAPRRLAVWVWYPAAKVSSGHSAAYAPGAWSQLHFPGLAGLGETDFGAIRTHARDNPPVAAGRFPLVILEPGLGLAAPQYTTLAENIASHGYVVAGVTPTYSANLTVLNEHPVHANGKGNPSAFDAANLHTGRAARVGDHLVGVWAADARFAATTMTRMGDVAGRFAGHVDASHISYVGHSFGGAAALEACRVDRHCAAAIDLDGTQFGRVVHTGLTKPFMIMVSQSSGCVAGSCRPASASDRGDLGAARDLLEASTGPAHSYLINGAAHFNFTDYATYYVAAPLNSLLALGSIDGRRGLTIAGAYAVAFLDQANHNATEPLLGRESRRFPEVRTKIPTPRP